MADISQIALQAAKAFYEEMVDLKTPAKGVPCLLEGVLESVCVPLSEVRDEMPFCSPVVKEHICIPIFHVSSRMNEYSFEVLVTLAGVDPAQERLRRRGSCGKEHRTETLS